jgi:hypothetical protein
MEDYERKWKQQARNYTTHRIAQGELWRQPCEICGVEPAECHHIDYNDPDRVMWLCKLHHAQTHSQFGKPAPADWMADIRQAQRRIDEARLASRRARADQSGEASDEFE